MQHSRYTRIHARTLGGLAFLAGIAGTAAALAPAIGEDMTPSADAAAIAAGRLPEGYRDWRLVSVAEEEGKLNDLRAILGNDIALAAFRARQNGAQQERQPFPDGTVIARIAWDHEALAESAAAFGKAQSYVAVHPKNGVQFMIKDARKYAATGGWGFAQFDDGKPADPSKLTGCFACHQAVKGRDFVFTRYAP